ncbi:hypothetical protein ABZ921_16940 [Streptomyces atriruber]|uniref:Uncharacterized protein n=1 Tax=Streptomyces atriruber TaxID=545121 RepID=A0ABV3BMR8_9ACTN
MADAPRARRSRSPSSRRRTTSSAVTQTAASPTPSSEASANDITTPACRHCCRNSSKTSVSSVSLSSSDAGWTPRKHHSPPYDSKPQKASLAAGG